MAAQREQAMLLSEPPSIKRKLFVLEGALLYSRPCEDQNLPLEDRNDFLTTATFGFDMSHPPQNI